MIAGDLLRAAAAAIDFYELNVDEVVSVSLENEQSLVLVPWDTFCQTFAPQGAVRTPLGKSCLLWSFSGHRFVTFQARQLHARSEIASASDSHTGGTP